MPALLAPQPPLREHGVSHVVRECNAIQGAHPSNNCMQSGAAFGQQWNGMISGLQSIFLLGTPAPANSNFQSGFQSGQTSKPTDLASFPRLPSSPALGPSCVASPAGAPQTQSPDSPSSPDRHSSIGTLRCPRTPSTSPRSVTDLDIQAALAQAAEAYRQGEFQQVIESCQKLHSIDSSRPDVLLLLGAAYYQLGDYSRCIATNDAAILLNPSIPEAYSNLANALQRMGAWDLAITYYTSALRLKPNFVDAYVNLAAAYLHRGWLVPAAEAYSAALALEPGLIAVRCSLGDLWRGQGEAGRAAAEQCFGTALQYDPGCGTAWRGLGDCARERGDIRRAFKCYKEAVKIMPESVEAFTGLGIALRELKRGKEAEEAFAKAVMLRPSCALALGNLAGSYYENRKLEEAVSTYRAAILVNPMFSEAYNNLGNALRESGRPEESVGCYVSCIQMQLATLAQASTVVAAIAPPTPGSVAADNNASPATAAAAAQRLSVSYNNLGGVLKLLGRSSESITAYEHVVMLQPGAPEGHTNLGSSYKDVGAHDKAISSYTCALSLRPDFPEAFANLVHSMQCVCDWKNRDAMFMQLEREVLRDLAIGKLPSVQPFHAMAYPFSASLALAISKRYAQECLAVARRLPESFERLPHPSPNPLRPGERLRVGYVSPDFANHPLSHLMGSVFGLQDRSRVEVFCYALTPDDGSEWRERITNESEHFVDVSTWSAPAIAQRISSDGIHILVNLNGYTKGARNEVFALRPAPVQTSLMGFPATMGADYIPWIVLDKTVCPSESRHCYSECIAYMPHTYFVNDYRRSNGAVLEESTGSTAGGVEPLPTRASVGLPEDKIVYSCANQLYKYDPGTFTAWCNILKRVPESVLWLLRFPAAGESRVLAEAAARGVDPGRLIFTDVAPKPLHIARSGLADVFLDTPACNAHTTGCDVLWGGCPMITLPGDRMASRVAASLCHATGFGDKMVTSSLQDYEERAVSLGLNHQARIELRDALRAARTTCPLFDTELYVSNLDKLLHRMWDIHCEGKGPRDFEI